MASHSHGDAAFSDKQVDVHSEDGGRKGREEGGREESEEESLKRINAEVSIKYRGHSLRLA